MDSDGFHQHALVPADGLQVRGLADDAIVRLRTATGSQDARALHLAFLVGCYHDVQGAAQSLGIEARGHRDGHGQETLHVSGSKAMQAGIARGQRKRIALPALVVIRHRIAVSGQDQSAFPAAQSRDQIGLARRLGQSHDFDRAADVFEIAGQAFDHGEIGTVEFRRNTAYRGNADKIRQQFLCVQHIGSGTRISSL